jgi:hypothetical protein
MAPKWRPTMMIERPSARAASIVSGVSIARPSRTTASSRSGVRMTSR